MHRSSFLCALAAFFLLGASVASAVPLVSVDLDPATAGVQSSRDIGVGETVDVAITISGVEPGAPLNAFELDLLFDPSVAGATLAAGGGFLVPPTSQVELDLTAPDVNYAETTIGAAAASGAGVLVTVSFQGVAPGATALTLANVLLAAPFGQPISPVDLASGSLRVIASAPEPGFAAGLLLPLLSGIANARRRSARLRGDRS
ncbi:MAG: hypothetical protein QNK05_01195 [Myxococcota bacterium]|nr:hypothetical protein [Myxococcota bacterium]